jgi:isopentenyl-diphosphate Delta-isomerase
LNTKIDSPELMEARKRDHIRICATENVESQSDGFSNIHLIPDACPDFSLADTQLNAPFMGRAFSMPLLITGMTGGVQYGQALNEALATAAQNFDVPMGLGSLKMLVAQPHFRPYFDLKPRFPKLFLLGNIGLSSFNNGLKIDDALFLIESLKLDGFALHLNALQECVQPEGERNFHHSYEFIQDFIKRSPVPVLIKEVGSGISQSTCLKLWECGVRAIDVGGRGGTSWSAIEGRRGSALQERLGSLFRNWGLSTEQSLRECLTVNETIPQGAKCELVATGGVRDGWQMAKALALGANMCGVGLPLFRAAVGPDFANQGMTVQPELGSRHSKAVERVEDELEFFQNSLRIAMFCSGAQNVRQLPSKLWQGKQS